MNTLQIPPFAAKFLIYLLLGIAVIFVLMILQQLLAPLFFAVMFAYLLYPAAKKMEKIGIPRVITNLILIIATIIFILLAIFTAGYFFTNFADDVSQIRAQLGENLNHFRDLIQHYTGYNIGDLQEQLNGLDGTSEYIINFFTATTNTLVAIALIPVYTFLLLLYRNKFRIFLDKIISGKHEQTANAIIDRATEVVPQYLKGLVIVVSILMVINSTTFWLIGIEYAIVFGIIAALWNLIPYLGTIIGFGTVFMMVLITQSPSLAFGVVLAFFPIQFFENNILTPNITGSYVQINPLIIILSLFAGSMIWGLPGMLLVIPYLAMAKIICENINSLKPVAYLIGTRGTEEYFLTIEKIKKKLGIG